MSLAGDSERVIPAPAGVPSFPLVVDLDGTLLRGDMFLETLVAALKHEPWLAFVFHAWLAQGRAAAKRRLAERVRVDVAHLPYDERVLAALRRERALGRRLVLATATDERIARSVADHLGLFDEVIASDGRRNMKGATKAAVLVERFGERGFDYAGQDRFDLPVWERARGAMVVGASASVLRHLERLGRPVERIERADCGIVHALRLHHWAKNALVFVPLVTAHKVSDAASVLAVLMAFLAFGFVASAVYLLNDLADLAEDRKHPTKRHRALASGELPAEKAVAFIPLLLAAAAAICMMLPWIFGALLLSYVAANLAYSVSFKRVAVLDVFVLAGLYTLRILAGAAAIAVPVSHWLLAFSLFTFLSLALAKRYVEVSHAASRDEAAVGGRGYVAQDRTVLAMLGTASGYLAALVFALYLTSTQVVTLYRRPEILWFAFPLFLYWISRTWFIAYRDRLDEDPLVFALRDPVSYVLGALVLVVMFAAA